ncbi:SixA phosphatase family protein [Parenemella sanctibonifatiensis]|uniref:Phosphoglycerate mutase n=1 Tax=Parenemella sanctibonifatiensis TaxID=2016505 RepID=A0A255EKV0_9ACTN|nr:histidine phosphatase family protein [Parenemella sanctibonifatiensis]OYN92157.1 phosphoglycerate mutase [Parenemella sanctibonifatiensis]
MAVSFVRTLILLRHGKSSWTADTNDSDRPLASRGRLDAHNAGRSIKRHRLNPDLVVCSPTQRSKDTWECVADAGLEPQAVAYSTSVEHGPASELARDLVSTPGMVRCLMMVGHTPTMRDLIDQLARPDGDNPAWRKLGDRFPTGAFAVLTFDGGWEEWVGPTGQLALFEAPGRAAVTG